jgi:hypothetical protein
MGKAPTWLTKEREMVALAWLHVTNNGIQGCDQKGEDYQNKIHALFKAFGPRDAPPGHYGDPAPKAVYVFLCDNIFPDINKFNESLRLIQSSNPTGMNDDNIISMAITLHLGKTKWMDYNLRDYEHTQWPNYSAWKILSSAPKFHHPTMGSLSMAAPDSIATADASTIDPTATRNAGKLPFIVSLSDGKSVEMPLTSHTLEPSLLEESVSTESLLRHTNDILQERVINNMKRGLYPAVAHHLPAVPNLDPSHGGHGSAMGSKKAKLEQQKTAAELEKKKQWDRMEQRFNKQTRQQEELTQVFKLRQMMKIAQSLKNQRLFEKVEDEIEKLLLPPPSINLENHDEDTITLDSIEINGGISNNIGDDDDDDDDDDEYYVTFYVFFVTSVVSYSSSSPSSSSSSPFLSRLSLRWQ